VAPDNPADSRLSPRPSIWTKRGPRGRGRSPGHEQVISRSKSSSRRFRPEIRANRPASTSRTRPSRGDGKARSSAGSGRRRGLAPGRPWREVIPVEDDRAAGRRAGPRFLATFSRRSLTKMASSSSGQEPAGASLLISARRLGSARGRSSPDAAAEAPTRAWLGSSCRPVDPSRTMSRPRRRFVAWAPC